VEGDQGKTGEAFVMGNQFGKTTWRNCAPSNGMIFPLSSGLRSNFPAIERDSISKSGGFSG
jgi:hypothetical protein